MCHVTNCNPNTLHLFKLFNIDFVNIFKFIDVTLLPFRGLIIGSIDKMHVLSHRFSFPCLLHPKHGSGSPGILFASSFLDIARGSEVWMQIEEHNRHFASLTEEFGIPSVWLQETEGLRSHGNRRQTHACMIYRLPWLLTCLDNMRWWQFWKICLKYSTGLFCFGRQPQANKIVAFDPLWR